MARARQANAPAGDDELAEAARELYAAPVDGFVATRTARAKQLRADGQRELAARVAKLPKPTRDAWAIDQATRERPDLVEQLMQTVADMQSPGSAARLRALADEHEAHVRELAHVADGHAGGGKVSELAAAIRAAAVSADAQAFVHGTLARIPQAGDESLAAALAAGAALGGSAPRKQSGRSQRERRARKEREQQLREERRRLERQLAEARGELARAEREAERARGRIDELESELDQLEK